MFDENSMRFIFSLADVADSHSSTIDASIGNAFCDYTSKVINLHGNTKDRMNEVNGCASDNVSTSDYKSILEKEGTAKAKKIDLTN